jgi:REP element-mobilizing transposase RayT
VFEYVLAVAASECGVDVHVVCVMSNHYHLIVTDPDSQLPKFMQRLNSLVARCLNVSQGRSEAFWDDTRSYSAVVPVSAEDVLEKAVYVLANPVNAGLVRTGREWPGMWSAPERIGSGPTILHRPEFFFRENGPSPETVELELTAPPGFESPDAFREAVVAALSEREREIAAAMAAEGRSFVGARRVLAEKTTTRPSPKERVGGLDPRIAARDKWQRIDAVARLVEFRRAYRAAWTKLRQGVRDVVFPAGTYWLRIAHGVRCEAPV